LAKRVVVIAHCLLNYHAKILNSGVKNEAGKMIIPQLLERGYGIIQSPCPEFTHGGLKRWGQCRSQYNNPFFISHCHRLAGDIINQLEEYRRCGYAVGPVLGINGSPSCGIDFCFDGEWGGKIDNTGQTNNKRVDQLVCVRQPGVFMEVLRQGAIKRKIDLVYIGIDENKPEKSLETILSSIE
jgi:predicted secreted protein